MGELYEGNKLQVECCDTPVQQVANIPIASTRGNPTTASHAEAFTEWRLPGRLFRLIIKNPFMSAASSRSTAGKRRKMLKGERHVSPVLGL